MVHGEAAAYIQGDSGPLKVKRFVGGDFFGEIALLTDAPRMATIKTELETRVLFITKSKFDHAVGKIKHILKKNISKYPRIFCFR